MVYHQFPQHKNQGQSVFLALTALPRAFALVWKTSRALTLTLGLITIFQGLIPAGQAWSTKLIVDSVVKALANSDNDVTLLAPALGVALGVAFANQLLNNAAQLAQDVLRDLLAKHINTRIVEKASSLDLSFYETSDFYNTLQRARQEANYRPLTIMQQIFSLVRAIVTLTSLIGLLMRFGSWTIVLLIISSIPSLILTSKLGWVSANIHYARAQTMRELNYYGSLLTDKQCIKEVKLFGLGPTLLKRYSDLYQHIYTQNRVLTLKRNIGDFLIQTLSQIGYFGAYIIVIKWTLEGRLSLGDMTMYSSILLQTQSALGLLMFGLADLYEQNLFLTNLFSFLKLKPLIGANGHSHAITSALRSGFELQDVTFQYPGATEPTLYRINIKIELGERLAIVGQNGAGKTTLVKLLTRLYDPTEGGIILDGYDLKDIDPINLQSQIGVLFQDFVHYPLSGRENIGFGCIKSINDNGRIQAAAQKSGIHETLVNLPEGYDTPLGRIFNDSGPDLSVGQWQKVALARAYLRDAPILILDEPTASLDAQTEYEVFKQFKELAQNRIVILISHRFSNVRLADRIVVLDHGRIVEQGTHTELMAADGQYAMMFNLQAEAYR